jgi:hypothetical protein
MVDASGGLSFMQTFYVISTATPAGTVNPRTVSVNAQETTTTLMFVGAVYDRALFLESTKYTRSQTAPTADSSLLGQLGYSSKTEWNELASTAVIDFEIACLSQSPEIRR